MRKRSERWKLLIAATLVAAAFGHAPGQQDKPFSQWTRQEAEKILNEWSITQEVRIKYDGRNRPVAGGPPRPAGIETTSEQSTISSAGAEAPVDFQFTVRLRSALPVRQALARLRQLEARYERMDEKERAAFDARTKGLVDCPACADNYVLTVSSRSTQSPGADPVFSLFKGGRLADLQRYIYIANEQGERRALIHFVPPRAPGEEATFFFPRLDEKGLRLLTPENRELIFNLTNNEVNIVTNFRISVSKLTRDGRVEF